MPLVTKAFADIITFTRASSGTYFDATGTLQTATTNAARFDYNPSTLAARGMLVEEQRTNLAIYNRDLTDAAWVKTNITAAKDQIGITGGANTASKITATAANATILQTITSASAARSTSAYVKRITGTGTVEMTQDNGSTWAAVTVTSAWTRVTIASATVTNPVVGFRIVTDTDAIAVDFVQCENGAFPTSAIATTTASATRSADVASVNTLSPWYNAAAGTVFVEADQLRGNGRLFMFQDNASIANRFEIRGNGGYPTLNSWTSSVQDVNLISSDSVSDPSGIFKTAAAIAVNNAKISTNGGSVGTDTSCSMPLNISQLYLGSFQGTATIINGYLRRITYYPRVLSDAELQGITA